MPHHHSVLRLRDGRILSYCCYGEPQGLPVYFFHGFPGSRVQAQLIENQAATHGLCLVATDRPGVGRSDPRPGRTIGLFASDILELAVRLGHSRFGVLGASCGGPYALACAAALPQKVVHVGLMAGIGPMDRPELRRDQHRILRWLFALSYSLPAVVLPLFYLERAAFLRNSTSAVRKLARLMTLPDRCLLEKVPEVGVVLGESLAEAYRRGIEGIRTEAALIAGPRDTPLELIGQRVDLFQGGQDRNVPPVMASYMAGKLKNASVHFFENEGHLSILLSSFPSYAERFKSEYGQTRRVQDS